MVKLEVKIKGTVKVDRSDAKGTMRVTPEAALAMLAAHGQDLEVFFTWLKRAKPKAKVEEKPEVKAEEIKEEVEAKTEELTEAAEEAKAVEEETE